MVVLGNLNGAAPGNIAGNLSALAHGEAVTLQTERKEIQVSPQILAKYAGRYELRPGIVATMTVEDGRLMSQLTGQPKVGLFAESETKFFLKVVDAQIEFLKDSTGAVTHLILHQGGQDQKAPRIGD